MSHRAHQKTSSSSNYFLLIPLPTAASFPCHLIHFFDLDISRFSGIMITKSDNLNANNANSQVTNSEFGLQRRLVVGVPIKPLLQSSVTHVFHILLVNIDEGKYM